MKTIFLKQFGHVLISRSAGSEAFNAIRPDLKPEESVLVDFDGLLTVTPSWLDEFLTHLTEYHAGKVDLLPTTNASVLAILPVLAQAREDLVAATVRRAMQHQGTNE